MKGRKRIGSTRILVVLGVRRNTHRLARGILAKCALHNPEPNDCGWHPEGLVSAVLLGILEPRSSASDRVAGTFGIFFPAASKSSLAQDTYFSNPIREPQKHIHDPDRSKGTKILPNKASKTPNYRLTAFLEAFIQSAPFPNKLNKASTPHNVNRNSNRTTTKARPFISPHL